MFQDMGLHLLLSFWAVEHIRITLEHSRIHGTGKEANSKSFRSLLLFCIAKPWHPSHGGLQLWYLWWTELVGTLVELLFSLTMTTCAALHCESRARCADGALPSHRPLHHQRHTEIKNSNILAWPNTHKWHSYRTLLLFSIRSHPAELSEWLQVTKCWPGTHTQSHECT